MTKTFQFRVLALVAAQLALALPGPFSPAAARSQSVMGPAVQQASGLRARNREAIVAPSRIGGPSGMRVGRDGKLYFGAVLSRALFRDRLDGSPSEQVSVGNDSGADDLAFLADGTLVLTAMMADKVVALAKDGSRRELSLPGADGIAVDHAGRLFVSQCFAADALWEIDPVRMAPLRKVADHLGCLNGFDFGPDGMLYGPSWIGGTILRLNPNTGETTPIVTNLPTPAAVRFDQNGRLLAVVAGNGKLLSIDPATGHVTEIARFEPGLDNILPLPDGTVLVSNIMEGWIARVDGQTGHEKNQLFHDRLVAPGGIAVSQQNGRALLYIADGMTLRVINPGKGHRPAEVGSIYADPGIRIAPPRFLTVGRRQLFLAASTGQLQALDLTRKPKARTIALLDQPFGMVELDNDSLAVAEFAKGRILRVDVRGRRPPAEIASGLEKPIGLARLGKHALLVTDWEAGTLVRVSLSDGSVKKIVAGLNRPQGLVVLSSRVALLAEAGEDRIVTVNLDTGQITVLVDAAGINLESGSKTPPFQPAGLALSSGYLYWNSNRDRGIYRIELAGCQTDMACGPAHRRPN